MSWKVHSFRPFLFALESRLAPATFTVVNTNDNGSGSFRQAILNANSAVGADEVVFDPTFFANPTTITLTTGQISITDALMVSGPIAKLTIDANKASRIFSIDVPIKAGQAISINNLTVI